MLPSLIFTLSQDIEPKKQFHEYYQLLSMEIAMTQRPDVRTDFLEYIVADPRNSHTVCEWRGVTCTPDDRDHDCVTTFLATGSDKHYWWVNIGWLPNSLQFVYFTSLDIDSSFSSRTLPKDLQFMELYSCRVIEAPKNQKPLDLQHLPPRLQEFHIVESWVAKTVVIDNIPPNLRLLRVTSAEFKTAVLGHADAPKLFQFRLHLEKWYQRMPRIVASEGSLLQKRIATVGDYDSRWARDLWDACAALYRETNGYEDADMNGE